MNKDTCATHIPRRRRPLFSKTAERALFPAQIQRAAENAAQDGQLADGQRTFVAVARQGKAT